MEELKKLIRILEQGGKGSANALLDFKDTASLEVQLYRIVKGYDYSNEMEAQLQLYGSTEKSSAYKMLKSRVKKKLYNQLHFLDFDNLKQYTKLRAAEIKCNIILNEALILSHLEAVQLREKLIAQALKIAREAALTSQTIRALELQRKIYYFDAFNKKKFYQVADELAHYNDLHQQEQKADDLYYRLMIETRVGVKNRAEHYTFINECAEKLYQLWKQTSSSHIFSRYYVAKTIVLESSGDNEELINHLSQSEEVYLKGDINPYHYNYQRNLFALTYTYLKSKQYTAGLQTAERLKAQLDPHHQNWFAHQENYLMLAMHSGGYQKAKELLSEVYGNSFFDYNIPAAKERWDLFHEFSKLISADEGVTKQKLKFRYITQDKNGYNVWYVILEFIKGLKTGDTELMEQQVERLRKYSFKHFDAKSDQRTRLFLKLLLIAGQEHHNMLACKRKGRYLLSKLEQTPVAGDSHAEMEIIPYEHLWEFILKSLQK